MWKIVFLTIFILSVTKSASLENALGEVLARFDNGLMDISFRHPESEGRCLSVDKDEVFLADCKYTGENETEPDSSQSFTAWLGGTSDSNKFSLEKFNSQLCLTLGTSFARTLHLVYKRNCNGKAWDRMAFRRLAAVGDRHLIQNVGTGRCIKAIPGFKELYASICDEKDVQQHFITCNAYDKECGWWKLA